MSITTVNPQNWNIALPGSVMASNEQKDQVIADAIHKQDLEKLMDSFLRDKDPTRPILLDYETNIELMFWSILNNRIHARDWCLDRLFELGADRYESDQTLEIIEKLKEYLVDPRNNLSDEFYKGLHIAFKELYRTLTSYKFSKFLSPDTFADVSTTYLEIALNLMDQMLVSLALRHKPSFNLRERECLRRLFNSPFSGPQQNLVMIILSHHYGLEDLLPEGETIQDLIQDAFLEKDKYLLMFLGNQGCDVSKYLELIDIGFSDWVFTWHSDGRTTETVRRLDTNEIVEL